MTKRFLVASDDESVSDWEPVIVSAENKDGAIDFYLRTEYSKDAIFRASVLDLSINGSFVERFFVVSPAENDNFERTGHVAYQLDDIKTRIRSFFSDRPDLGERYVRYLDTQNPVHLNDEVFEFISATDASGIIALDLEEIRQLP